CRFQIVRVTQLHCVAKSCGQLAEERAQVACEISRAVRVKRLGKLAELEYDRANLPRVGRQWPRELCVKQVGVEEPRVATSCKRPVSRQVGPDRRRDLLRNLEDELEVFGNLGEQTVPIGFFVEAIERE